LLLFGALYLLGSHNGDGGGSSAATTTGRTTTTPVPARTTKTTSTTSGSSSSKKKKASSSSKLVRLQLVPTGPAPVFACLVDASGTARIPGTSLQQGSSAGPYRSKSFRLLLGNGNARLRVDGKLRTVPQVSPVAFKIRKGSVKRVDPKSVPSCSR
ncbi:MAG: hypothetical protein JWQ18_2055, partial [Conexibacter sp.]|nr:hypothetical protein [Conexibacter sp.]